MRSVTGKQYGEFLIAIFDEWVRCDVGRVYVVFDRRRQRGQVSAWAVHRADVRNALAMEHNGDVFSCDHFVEPRHKLGNMIDVPLSELVGSEQQRRRGRPSAIRCRATVVNARCASSATAAVPRIASCTRPTASRG